MTILIIILLSAIVFASRYLFLEPAIPLKLNEKMRVLLSYSMPAVLTAIWVPIVFLPEGELAVTWHNPYLVAATLAFVLARYTANVLLTTIASMAVFVALNVFV